MGKLSRADSTKQMISELTSAFQVNETYLAGFLMVTEKSLNEWKKLPMGDLTPKAYRLTRLHQVLRYIEEKHPEVPTAAYKSIVENGRVAVDNADDYGSVSLLNFILTVPESQFWIPCVEQVISEFKKTLTPAVERVREHRGPASKFT